MTIMYAPLFAGAFDVDVGAFGVDVDAVHVDVDVDVDVLFCR